MRKMVSSWTASAKTDEESKPRSDSSAAHKLMSEPTKDAKIKAMIGPMLPSMIVCNNDCVHVLIIIVFLSASSFAK